MTFFFGIIDLLLTSVLLFDTLGLAYQYRNKSKETLDQKEYIRVCLSWILLLTINNFLSCEKKSFFGTICRLIILGAKLFVVLPVLGGTLKFYQFFIVEKRAEKWFELLKSKICKNKCTSSSSNFRSNDTGETISQ